MRGKCFFSIKLLNKRKHSLNGPFPYYQNVTPKDVGKKCFFFVNSWPVSKLFLCRYRIIHWIDHLNDEKEQKRASYNDRDRKRLID